VSGESWMEWNARVAAASAAIACRPGHDAVSIVLGREKSTFCLRGGCWLPDQDTIRQDACMDVAATMPVAAGCRRVALAILALAQRLHGSSRAVALASFFGLAFGSGESVTPQRTLCQLHASLQLLCPAQSTSVLVALVLPVRTSRSVDRQNLPAATQHGGCKIPMTLVQ
jgi:hypothetical protein